MGPPPAPLTATAPPRLRTIVGASAVGASHTRRALPCQDAFRVREKDGAFAIAVADGLGSAPHSQAGAVVATEAAATRALRFAAGDPCIAAVEGFIAARDSLELVASTGGCSLASLACTLIVVVGDADRIGIAHIGDGAVVAARGDNVHVLSPPAPTEYVNEVDPLTAKGWEERVRWMSCRTPIDALALFTDGCQHAALRPTNGTMHAHAGFFVPLFDFVRSGVSPDDAHVALAQLLAGRKMSEHSDDDKTLVLAVM